MIFLIVWHNWLFKWIYQNDGVGNFLDDVLLLFMGYFVGKLLVSFVKRQLGKIHDRLNKHHAEQQEHNRKMVESQQKLHDHLGTGHQID